MECIDTDLWLWTTSAKNFNYKIIFDDNGEKGWEEGPDRSPKEYKSEIIVPVFTRSVNTQECNEATALNTVYSLWAMADLLDARMPVNQQIDLLKQIAVSLFPDESAYFEPKAKVEVKEYAQKCVLSHPSLLPFFIRRFPNLFSSLEPLIDQCFQTAARAHECQREFRLLALCESLPVTKEAIEMFVDKVNSKFSYPNMEKIRKTCFLALAKVMHAEDLFINYLINSQNIDPILLISTARIKCEQISMDPTEVFSWISLFTKSQGWECLPASFESQILGINNPDHQKKVLSLLAYLLQKCAYQKTSLNQFTFFIENQWIWTIPHIPDPHIYDIPIKLITDVLKNESSRKYAVGMLESLKKDSPSSEQGIVPDWAPLPLLLLSSMYGRQVASKEVCDALFNQVRIHFTQAAGDHHGYEDTKIYISVLTRILKEKELNLLSKEYLLDRISKEPALIPCLRMVRAIIETDGIPCLQKCILEKGTFNDILETCFQMDAKALRRLKEGDLHFPPSPIKSETRLVKIDPEKAKMTAEILNSDGFKKEESRDSKFGCRDEQTVAEVQGSSIFCEKTNQLTIKTPSILSPSYLRDQQNINPIISLTLRDKRVGHAFNLKGMVKLPDGTSQSLEGFNETFVIPMLRDMFAEFAAAREDLISQELHAFVGESLSKAVWHDIVTDEKIAEVHKLIHDPSYPYPVVVSSGWVWHSTQAIFYGKYLLYCNRGADCDENSGISIFKIANKENITQEFLKRIASRFSVDNSEYTSLEKIKIELSATYLSHVPMKEQKVGNCVYVNAKAAIFAILWAGVSREDDVKLNRSVADAFNLISRIRTKNIYKEFSKFDKEAVLENFLIDLEEASSGKLSMEENRNYFEGLNTVADVIKKWALVQRGKNEKISSGLLSRALRLICLRDWTLG